MADARERTQIRQTGDGDEAAFHPIAGNQLAIAAIHLEGTENFVEIERGSTPNPLIPAVAKKVDALLIFAFNG